MLETRLKMHWFNHCCQSSVFFFFFFLTYLVLKPLYFKATGTLRKVRRLMDTFPGKKKKSIAK